MARPLQTAVAVRYIMSQLNLCCCFGALGYGGMDWLERLIACGTRIVCGTRSERVVVWLQRLPESNAWVVRLGRQT
jgi:hypothetical protein